MREPTRIGAVVVATERDHPERGPESWTRIGPAEPEDSTEPDYTPWVRTEHVESGRYFHRHDEGTRGVGHYSWDQLDPDNARLAGPVGDALAEIMRSGGVDGAHHKQWTLDQVVRILTECPEVNLINLTAVGGPLEYRGLGESEEYLAWRREYSGDPDDENEYYGEWDTGIAP